MPQSYDAILDGDCLQWPNGRPSVRGPVRARVTVLDDADDASRPGVAIPGVAMADALRALADLDAFAEIEDPVAWQREQRADRPVPDREA